MQIAIELPDKLAREFNERFKQAEREKIIKETIKENIKKKNELRTDSFFKWALWRKDSGKETRNDVAEKHDEYLYGDKR